MPNLNARVHPRDCQIHSSGVRGKWAKLAVLLIVGYLGMGKSFAYVGLPWISVYLGEMVLLAFLLLGPETKQGPWLRLARRIRQLKRLEWLLLATLLYGCFEALHGILQGYSVLTAFRDTAFNYYPIFLLLGIWLGIEDRDFLYAVVRVLALWAGCYGLAWITFLSRIPWTMPGTAGRVPLFLGPYGASAVALLGLLAFEPRLRRVWHLILLNGFVLLGSTSRADWVGLAVGVLVFAWLMKNAKQLVVAGGLFILLLGLMYVAELNLLSPTGRGEKVGARISVGYLAARALAPLNKNLAQELAPAETVDFDENTAEWRLVWWANIWAEVHAQLSSTLIGFGYGYPIGNLNPDIEAGTFIQTPHNDFLYVLAFSGWLGVVLFILLHVELFRLLRLGFKVTTQPFGLVCWAALLTMSFFEDFFEAPFGAIPFYLLVGASIAPALLHWQRRNHGGLPVPLSNSPSEGHP